MEIQTNFDAYQALKNLTQAGIDEEQAAALVSTFGSFSEKIATKDDLAGIKREMKAMEARLMQRDDALEKTLTQEMGAMEARQSQKSDYLEKTLTQEMKAMETKQSQEMSAMDTKQSQRSDYLEKNLTKEIAKSRYMMFAAVVTAALVVFTLHEALGRFLS